MGELFSAQSSGWKQLPLLTPASHARVENGVRAVASTLNWSVTSLMPWSYPRSRAGLLLGPAKAAVTPGSSRGKASTNSSRNSLRL